MKNSSNPEETLRKGSLPSGNDIGAPGNSEGPETKTTSSNGSNLETLRQGSKPAMEAVRQAKMDMSCQKRALKAWQASNGDQGDDRPEHIEEADEMD